MQYYLAVDIGASHGRHVLGYMEDEKMHLSTIHEFVNKPIRENGRLCWDLDYLFSEIIQGLKKCKELDMIPHSVSIDTWGVDFVLLDENDNMIYDAVSYLDFNSDEMYRAVEEKTGAHELYIRTGIQRLPFNTVYRLASLMEEQPEYKEHGVQFLMLPDYFNFLLTGQKNNEYTNATTTGMVNVHTKTWDTLILDRLECPTSMFRPLSQPGTPLGRFTKQIEDMAGFSCNVVLAATHDTASAFLAIPVLDDKSVCLSSGTWSLLGIESDEPVITEEGRRANFTNEGGYNHTYRYLKNIIGMRMIERLKKQLGGEYTYKKIKNLAKSEEHFVCSINTDNPLLLTSEDIAETIREACKIERQPVPQNTGQIIQCIYQSLASTYLDTIRQLEKITGKRYQNLHIVGGGSQNSYLNSLIAAKTRMDVYAGPAECTSIGNITVQMLAAGDFPDLRTARKNIFDSFDVEKYTVQERSMK